MAFCLLFEKMTKKFKIPGTICSGTGKETVVNGSKVTDYILQVGQITLDLYCPVKRSTMIDWFLLVCAIQLSRATI